MKNIIQCIAVLIFINQNLFAQSKGSVVEPILDRKALYDSLVSEKKKVIKEVNVSVFSSAGASTRLGKSESAVISPIDRTLNFQKMRYGSSGVSVGGVWNPIYKYKDISYNEDKDEYRLGAHWFSVALLLNIFKLEYSEAFDVEAGVDVGFGLGYRKGNFLVLGTVEFINLQQPRDYLKSFSGQTVTLFGSEEPVSTIDQTNAAFFYNKTYATLGIKMAYTFRLREDD